MASEFLEAVRRGDLDRVRTMLDVQPSLVNQVGRYGPTGPPVTAYFDLLARGVRHAVASERVSGAQTTPLCAAVRSGDLEMVSLLLDRGATLHPTEAESLLWSISLGIERSNILRPTLPQWPLVDAVEWGHRDVLHLLLSRGAEADGSERTGTAALWRACFAGRADLADILLSHGARIATADESPDHSMLGAAAMDGHHAVVDLLLQHGAPVDALVKILDPITWAAGTGTALHAAAMSGHRETVEWLLDRGARMDALTSDGDQPIHIAAFHNRVGVLDLLVNRGASPNAPNRRGWRPLHCACSRGSEGAVKLLLTRGADANAPSKAGETPLHRALYSGAGATIVSPVVQHLISAGADVDAITRARRSLLHIAVRYASDSTVDYLLSSGANPTVPGATGDTALHFAAAAGREATVRLLLN